jgi:hypothetical protein
LRVQQIFHRLLQFIRANQKFATERVHRPGKGARPNLSQKRNSQSQNDLSSRHFALDTMAHDNKTIRERTLQALENANTPKAGSLWKHYKGDFYRVQGLVVREATEQLEVCYFAEDDPLPCPWTRPLVEWLDTVSHQGSSVRRFSLVEEARASAEPRGNFSSIRIGTANRSPTGSELREMMAMPLEDLYSD